MLKDKNVVITGCNKGIGYSILKKFAYSKANIWACTRSENEEFREKCNKLSNEYGAKINNIYFDLRNNSSVIEGAKLILSQLKTVDILINNAGSITTSLLMTSKIEEIREIFEVNFFSHVTLTQLLLKKMINKNNSSIINVSSTAGIDPIPGRLAYSSAKSALIMTTKVLSKELGRYNIRVNTIAPGLTDTDLMHSNHTKEIIKQEISKIPSNRIASPDEIAEVVLFLASKKSNYINGQIIRIDGGI